MHTRQNADRKPTTEHPVQKNMYGKGCKRTVDTTLEQRLLDRGGNIQGVLSVGYIIKHNSLLLE